MDWIKKITLISALAGLVCVVVSCRISMGLAPISSIDYSKVKTITIAEFPNRAEYVYAPMTTEFNQKLKDMFIQQTRLQLVNANGDLEIDGEITGYNQYNEAVAADGYSSKVKLTMTVNVRYVNNTNHEEDFEQQFSAFQTYDSSLLLTDVHRKYQPSAFGSGKSAITGITGSSALFGKENLHIRPVTARKMSKVHNIRRTVIICHDNLHIVPRRNGIETPLQQAR